MSDLNSTDYYRSREQQERSLAKAATNPDIAAIHLEMADRYSELALQANHEMLPRLSVRNGRPALKA